MDKPLADIPSPIPPKLLIMLTGAVLTAHMGLLQGSVVRPDTAEPERPRAFIVRTLELAPPAPEQRPAVAPTAPPRPKPLVARPPKPAAVPIDEPNTPPAPVEQAQEATILIADATPVPPSVAEAPVAKSALAYAVPPSARLKYSVSAMVGRVPASAEAELLWQQDGTSYKAKLEVRLWLVTLRTQTSQGQITADGLAPTRFSDKARSEVAAHFERDKGKIVFSANTPDAPLLAGAQDRLSVFMQLGAMLAAAPAKYPSGTIITLPVVGPRAADRWSITVGSEEQLALPGGRVSAIKLERNPQQDYDQKLELWLAPDLGYLPVRLRLTEANGDVADQRWRSTEMP
jgi:hypothetical protein